VILHAYGASDVGKRRARNEDAFLIDEAIGLYVVADGMGGHAAGNVASQLAITAFHAAVSQNAMGEAILSANLAVWRQSRTDPAQSGMGTTLTAMLRDGESGFTVGHVGDSRLYRLRAGTLEQLTRDHSIAGTSMLTRAIGTHPDVEVDVFHTPVAPGDRFLICSDGLTGMVHDEDLRVMLAQDKGLEAICGDLIEAANLRGGIDNITVVLVGVAEGNMRI
jgi:serine/threonine protein phosphatase PrpC